MEGPGDAHRALALIGERYRDRPACTPTGQGERVAPASASLQPVPRTKGSLHRRGRAGRYEPRALGSGDEGRGGDPFS